MVLRIVINPLSCRCVFVMNDGGQKLCERGGLRCVGPGPPRPPDEVGGGEQIRKVDGERGVDGEGRRDAGGYAEGGDEGSVHGTALNPRGETTATETGADGAQFQHVRL